METKEKEVKKTNKRKPKIYTQNDIDLLIENFLNNFKLETSNNIKFEIKIPSGKYMGPLVFPDINLPAIYTYSNNKIENYINSIKYIFPKNIEFVKSDKKEGDNYFSFHNCIFNSTEFKMDDDLLKDHKDKLIDKDLNCIPFLNKVDEINIFAYYRFNFYKCQFNNVFNFPEFSYIENCNFPHAYDDNILKIGSYSKIITKNELYFSNFEFGNRCKILIEPDFKNYKKVNFDNCKFGYNNEVIQQDQENINLDIFFKKCKFDINFKLICNYSVFEDCDLRGRYNYLKCKVNYISNGEPIGIYKNIKYQDAKTTIEIFASGWNGISMYCNVSLNVFIDGENENFISGQRYKRILETNPNIFKTIEKYKNKLEKDIEKDLKKMIKLNMKKIYDDDDTAIHHPFYSRVIQGWFR